LETSDFSKGEGRKRAVVAAKAFSPVGKGDFNSKKKRFQQQIWSAEFPATAFLAFWLSYNHISRLFWHFGVTSATKN